ncbi:hypothetical protein CEXT_22261 [Caerostris extrusa]|uniref:Uncharacterized protein n=1 Tax=Caerostris extrusa TaxID=172846 RepID=A0AAV4TI49_CAEEX|nr:hypothetical protein CEXT_22261 [Caerostris extrusa]
MSVPDSLLESLKFPVPPLHDPFPATQRNIGDIWYMVDIGDIWVYGRYGDIWYMVDIGDIWIYGREIFGFWSLYLRVIGSKFIQNQKLSYFCLGRTRDYGIKLSLTERIRQIEAGLLRMDFGRYHSVCCGSE